VRPHPPFLTRLAAELAADGQKTAGALRTTFESSPSRRSKIDVVPLVGLDFETTGDSIRT
jgi:hypothetical protein